MNLVMCVVGIIGASALIAAGLGYVFAPAASQQLLKTTAKLIGIFLCCLLIASELACEHPVGFLIMILILSPIAYMVREGRRPRHHQQSLRGVERRPMMPHTTSEDDL